MLTDDELHAHFPKLATEGYEHTSPDDVGYNCIAWAAEDSQRWWWPLKVAPYYWPVGLPNEDVSIENFVAAFRTLGYEPCAGGELEEGFEKVVIYTQSGVPTHACRQLADGRWTSKLGREIDISHYSAESLEGPAYGRARQFLRRTSLRILGHDK